MDLTNEIEAKVRHYYHLDGTSPEDDEVEDVKATKAAKEDKKDEKTV